MPAARRRARFFGVYLVLLFAAASCDPPGARKPAALPPGSAPPATYATWHGRLPDGAAAADSLPTALTLHLVRAPPPNLEVWSATLTTAAGQSCELFVLRVSPDSLVLEEATAQTGGSVSPGPLWRLRRTGTAWTGTRAGQPLTLRPGRPPGRVDLQATVFTDSLAALAGLSGTAYAHCQLVALLPTAGPPALRANLLRALRGDTLPNRPAPALRALWEAQQTAFFRAYRAEVASARNDLGDSVARRPVLEYELLRQVAVVWNQGRLLTLGMATYAYSGGAHGIHYTELASFERRTGAWLRFANVFRPEAAAALGPLLDAAARRQFGLAARAPLTETLFVAHVPVTTNIGLTGAGVLFSYPPYALASYAQGEIRLLVPWSALRGLVTVEIQQLAAAASLAPD